MPIELLDEKSPSLPPPQDRGIGLASQLEEKKTPAVPRQTVHFELTAPEWNPGKLSRSFFSASKLIEEACQKADRWVTITEDLLEELVLSLPEHWPESDSKNVSSKFLGRFFGISQHHPISQYLECFAGIPTIPNTFPILTETPIQKESIKETASQTPNRVPEKEQPSKKESPTEGEQVTASVRMRAIGTFWLQYQHALQLHGTLSEAGDLYFVFLKATQRLFNLPPGLEIVDIRQDLINDIHQLSDNLRSAHRGHLMYIYKGFERELWIACQASKNHKLPKASRLASKLIKVDRENQESLEQLSKALEYVLEDFYIRLQFFQIRQDALNILDEEMKTMHRQYNLMHRQLANSIEVIQKGIPQDQQIWVDLDPFKFAFQMESVESSFHEGISKLKNVYRNIFRDSGANRMVNLTMKRCDTLAQSLPEHANIIHLEKLWSWSHKKIEIDEAVPLRYTIEQFFRTRLLEKLNTQHARWIEFLRNWTEQIDKQEQFFLFSFYALRQEWTDPISGWQNADRAVVYQELKESAHPTVLQFQTILEELEAEFTRFDQGVRQILTETVDDLEDVIFDPGLRQKLLKLASEGSGVVAAVLGMVLHMGQTNLVQQWPLVQKSLLLVEKAQTRWLRFKGSLRSKSPPPEFPLPAYYSRVFMVDPLEISSLFVGRKRESAELLRICTEHRDNERVAIAIVGMPGSGKRSLINYFVRNVLDAETVQIHLALLDNNISGIINSRPFSLEEIVHKIELEQIKVVVVDGLEACFVETMGGARPMLEFFEYLQKTPREIIWILAVNEIAWKTIELMPKTGGAFTHVFHLKPVRKKKLKEMLYKRHEVVGLPLQFKIPADHRDFKWLNKLHSPTCKRMLERHFFSELERHSMGLPAIAMKLWIDHCSILEDNTILLNPFIEKTQLPHLEEEEHLLLRIILAQGTVRPQHLQQAVVSSKSLRVALDNLKRAELIFIRRQNNETVFSVNPESYLTIYQLLKKSTLLP
ncbi:MAG: ATP-binding protein [SAR324 cluster bacterium]|nr:ATP-binding protein [SAR324 cluster bacterium]